METKFGVNDDIQEVLMKKGYKNLTKISETLQGCVYVGNKLGTNKKVAIKIAGINLYKNGLTLCGQWNVNENIIQEMKIIQYLQKKNPPKGFLRYIDFFNDDINYYFVMDYGGEPFWEYIMKNIELIEQNKLDINKWKIRVKKLFKQMCYYINWLHNNGVCHLDISLENCCIKDNTVYFCDFGLSEYFYNNEFLCDKFCGKKVYQAPEIYHKRKHYNAIKADIWSLGVTLFIMHTGLPLYQTPTKNDAYFCNTVNGFIKQMLSEWNMDHYISSNGYDLLKHIFKPEKHRYNVTEILNHSYLKSVKQYQ